MRVYYFGCSSDQLSRDARVALYVQTTVLARMTFAKPCTSGHLGAERKEWQRNLSTRYGRFKECI